MDLAKFLVDTIDIADVTVRPFDGYIFLCGGAIESSNDGFSSARHYALSRMDSDGKIAGHSIIIAEKMTSLLQGDDFSDLLEFEEHIAALSACVLIFVESPGSIAELGSFSVMPNLAARLLVVCEQRLESTSNPSFIFLGPIASLRRNRIESVQVFPIFADGGMGPDKEKLDECWEYIEESVLNHLRRPIQEAPLDRELLAHKMILVATIVNLFVAIKLGEIEESLNEFGIDLSTKALRRIIRMLEQFSLIKTVTYGNDKFIFSLRQHPMLILRPVASEAPAIFDHIRFKSRVIELYEESDSRRAKAIRAYLRGLKSDN